MNDRLMNMLISFNTQRILPPTGDAGGGSKRIQFYFTFTLKFIIIIIIMKLKKN